MPPAMPHDAVAPSQAIEFFLGPTARITQALVFVPTDIVSRPVAFEAVEVCSVYPIPQPRSARALRPPPVSSLLFWLQSSGEEEPWHFLWCACTRAQPNVRQNSFANKPAASLHRNSCRQGDCIDTLLASPMM